MEISLSTMWSAGCEDLAEFVRDARGFGFSSVELNYALDQDALDALLSVEGLKVSSVHAPCPNFETPDGRANTIPLSCPGEDRRRTAIDGVRASIDLCAQLGAGAVVVHAGKVGIINEHVRSLRRMHSNGLAETEEFARLRREVIDQRAADAPEYLERTMQGIAELADYARQKRVRLALENRVNYHEIPDLDEMERILAAHDPSLVGYWHDAGHAEIQSRLGFTPHDQWLSRLGHRMMGSHLHDLQDIRDHLAPGIGDLDWDALARKLPRDIIRVCEIGERNSREDLLSVVEFLDKIGIC